MRPRAWLPLLLLLVGLLIGGGWLFHADERPRGVAVPLPGTPLDFSSGDAGPASKPPTQDSMRTKGSPLVEELLDRSGPPEDDLEKVRQLISQYVTALQSSQGPPIGDNRDLVRALTGTNPLRLVVIPPGHSLLSGKGELLDRWGTPYHIHPLSVKGFEIRSAGPDRRLFSADDLVAR